MQREPNAQKQTKQTKQHTPHHSTCYHVCSPLLAWWVTGAMDTMRAEHTKMNATRAKQTKMNATRAKQMKMNATSAERTKMNATKAERMKMERNPSPLAPNLPCIACEGGYFFVSSSLSMETTNVHAHPPSHKTRGRVFFH
jgi:sRNA-binding protein